MSGLRMAIVGLSVAVVGGALITSARRSRSSGAATSAGSTAMSPASGNSPSHGGSAASPTATVREAMARVAGAAEIILVNDQGLPLYVHPPDTATASRVTGELAARWPSLLADAPTERGIDGVLAVVQDGNDQRVTYNGHFLYTFAEDTPRQVIGHGVQDFLVATPGLARKRAAATPGTTRATPGTTRTTQTGSRSSSGY
jgi:predicted lipoprotein with Yx(FWY)xxD motif